MNKKNRVVREKLNVEMMLLRVSEWMTGVRPGR